jgi:hypothetical protein
VGNTLSIPAQAGVIYQWFLNGSALPASNTNSILLQGGGTYEVSVYVLSSGCSVVSSPYAVLSVPNVASQAFKASIRPNPAAGFTELHFETTVSGQVEVDLLDATGRLISQQFAGPLPAGSHIQAVSMQLPGAYLVRLRTASENVFIPVLNTGLNVK